MQMSTMNHNYKHHQVMVQMHLFLVSTVFWVISNYYPTREMMSAADYGTLVVSIDAEIWAGCLMTSSTMYLYGLLENGRSVFSPFYRLFGALSNFLIYAFFAFSVMQDGNVNFVLLFCVFFFCPMMLFGIINNGLDCVNTMRSRIIGT